MLLSKLVATVPQVQAMLTLVRCQTLNPFKGACNGMTFQKGLPLAAVLYRRLISKYMNSTPSIGD